MTGSFAALCTDFYVNQRLKLTMDLPGRRETVLDMFDRVRREFVRMGQFHRFEDELALESPREEAEYHWLAMRRTSIRSGWVNPSDLSGAYRLHQLILEVAPYFLSISPLDVEHLELVFGFDLVAEANRNAIVFEALLSDSPLQRLVELNHEQVTDAQPFLGFALSAECDLQASVEVKTRTGPHEVASSRFRDEPISVYLTVRKCGPLRRLEDLAGAFGSLAGHAERLAEDRVIPHVVIPIRDTLHSRP